MKWPAITQCKGISKGTLVQGEAEFFYIQVALLANWRLPSPVRDPWPFVVREGAMTATR